MTTPDGYATSFEHDDRDEWTAPEQVDGLRIVPTPIDPMAVARASSPRSTRRRRRAAPPSPQHLLPLRRRPLARGRRAPRPFRAVALAGVGAVLEGPQEGRPARTRPVRAEQVQDRERPRGAEGDRPHRRGACSRRVWLDGVTATPINAGEIVPLANGILDFSTRELSRTRRSCSSSTCSRSPTTRRAPTAGVAGCGSSTSSGATTASRSRRSAEWFGYVLSNDTVAAEDVLAGRAEAFGQGHDRPGPDRAARGPQHGGADARRPDPELRAAAADRKAAGGRSRTRASARAPTAWSPSSALLSISGEDTLTIDRKYREPWTGRLPTRFMILTNELPRFSDSSGALASRFVMSILTGRSTGGRTRR